MLNKIIRSCLFYSGTRWCPRCIAFDSRIYCEKEQLGGFLWRTFYYAVKKDPYLSKDPVICLMEKRNSVCMSTSFIRYILPTLALSKSGFRSKVVPSSQPVLQAPASLFCYQILIYDLKIRNARASYVAKMSFYRKYSMLTQKYMEIILRIFRD